MLILHTAEFYPPQVNGVAEVVNQISTRLARRGHEIHVATSLPAGARAEEVRDGVHVHRFLVHGSAVSGLKGDVSGYLRFVNSKPWDVLVIHCVHVWNLDALLPHLDEIAVPTIVVSHGLSNVNLARYQAYFSGLAQSLRKVDQLVALSPLVEESAFCSQHGLPAPHIIPNGVDPVNWHKPALNVREPLGIGKARWLLSVSNHTPVKGHAAFFEVVRRLRKLRDDVFGTIVGGHYPAAKWNLGRLGIKGGCWYKCRLSTMFRAGVELRSRVPRPEVISAVKEADVVLITSRWEASPLVMLESMAAGTPWVSFDVGCARENAGGIVVGSTREMAETVLNLLDNPEQCRQLGRDGRARIATRHDWNSIADQYEELYSAVSSKTTV